MNFYFSDWLRRVDLRFKSAFFSAFAFGILSQGMGLFNKLSVHDDVMNYGVGATYISGRWMLEILSRLEVLFFGDGHYSLPCYNGFFAIFMIALSACLIISILEIRSPVLCVFISGLMVCFPVITSIFGYMFTLHFYMISLLFGVSGAFCICKSEKWWFWLIGIILIGASVGIYQAFFPAIITVILFYLIAYVIKCDDFRKVLKKVCLTGACCAMSMGLYFAASSLSLSYHHSKLTNYRGIDSMGKSSLHEYWVRIIDAYREFFKPSRGTSFYMYPGTIRYVYRIVVLLSILLSIILFFKLLRTKKAHALILAFLLTLVPLSVNFIFVMTGRDVVHSLMVYSQLFTFVYFAWLLENLPLEHHRAEKAVSSIVTVVFAALLLMYCRVDNRCYLKATYAQQEAISYFTTLITQIKEADEYRDELPVVFLNSNSDTSLRPGDDGHLSDIAYLPYNLDVNGYINNYTWRAFMIQWTGYSPVIANPDDFVELDEVKLMPHYPDDGSIKVINDTVVVKF